MSQEKRRPKKKSKNNGSVPDKLSCCCDSRSYCVRSDCRVKLTLFIVSTTSRPLNRKSVCCQTAIITANSQSVHLSARALQSAVSAHASESVVAPNGTVPTRSRRNAITVYRYWDLGLRFVFLWCILWLNDTSYSKSVKRDK